MKQKFTAGTMVWVGVALMLAVAKVAADQVEMKNGDRYVGKVLSLTADTLLLQSQVLGSVRLPRAQVALITLGTVSATNSTPSVAVVGSELRRPSLVVSNSSGELSATLRQLGANSNLVRQVQSQYLAGAGDDANQKFTELLNGLMNGSVSANDLRAQAKTAADQLRALKRDYGDESGSFDGYLAILESFLKETEPAGAGGTKASAPQAPVKPEAAPKQ